MEDYSYKRESVSSIQSKGEEKAQLMQVVALFPVFLFPFLAFFAFFAGAEIMEISMFMKINSRNISGTTQNLGCPLLKIISRAYNRAHKCAQTIRVV
jgi:hypothetical protein